MLLSPVRFCLVCEVRAVDHFSWSAFGENKGGSVNGYVNPCEKMKNDTLDKFTQGGCERVSGFGFC